MSTRNPKGIDTLSDSFVSNLAKKKALAPQITSPNKKVKTIKVSNLSELSAIGFVSQGTGIYKDAKHHLWNVERTADGYSLVRNAEEDSADSEEHSVTAGKKESARVEVVDRVKSNQGNPGKVVQINPSGEVLVKWSDGSMHGYSNNWVAKRLITSIKDRKAEVNLKEIKNKLRDMHYDRVSLSKDGVFTIKQGYFYRHGNSPEKIWEGIQKQFPDAELVDLKDDWRAWPKDSNFIIRFKFPGSAPEPESKPEMHEDASKSSGDLKQVTCTECGDEKPEAQMYDDETCWDCAEESDEKEAHCGLPDCPDEKHADKISVTENERKLLELIRDSEYHDGENPVDHSVWTNVISGYFGGTKKMSGVASSLVKKGLAVFENYGYGAKEMKEGVCWITQKGFDAIKEGKQAAEGDLIQCNKCQGNFTNTETNCPECGAVKPDDTQKSDRDLNSLTGDEFMGKEGSEDKSCENCGVELNNENFYDDEYCSKCGPQAQEDFDKNSSADNEIDQAYDLGKIAFNNGQKAAPVLDVDLMNMVSGKQAGEIAPFLQAFLHGWHDANLEGDKTTASNDEIECSDCGHDITNVKPKKVYRYDPKGGGYNGETKKCPSCKNENTSWDKKKALVNPALEKAPEDNKETIETSWGELPNQPLTEEEAEKFYEDAEDRKVLEGPQEKPYKLEEDETEAKKKLSKNKLSNLETVKKLKSEIFRTTNIGQLNKIKSEIQNLLDSGQITEDAVDHLQRDLDRREEDMNRPQKELVGKKIITLTAGEYQNALPKMRDMWDNVFDENDKAEFLDLAGGSELDISKPFDSLPASIQDSMTAGYFDVHKDFMEADPEEQFSVSPELENYNTVKDLWDNIMDSNDRYDFVMMEDRPEELIDLKFENLPEDFQQALVESHSNSGHEGSEKEAIGNGDQPGDQEDMGGHTAPCSECGEFKPLDNLNDDSVCWTCATTGDKYQHSSKKQAFRSDIVESIMDEIATIDAVKDKELTIELNNILDRYELFVHHEDLYEDLMLLNGESLEKLHGELVGLNNKEAVAGQEQDLFNRDYQPGEIKESKTASSVEEIAETYVNGNLSDARNWVGGNLKKYNLLRNTLLEMGQLETPEDISMFERRMEANKTAIKPNEDIGSGKLPNKYTVVGVGDFFIQTDNGMEWIGDVDKEFDASANEDFGTFDTFPEALNELRNQADNFPDSVPTDGNINTLTIEDHITGIIYQYGFNAYPTKSRWNSGYVFELETYDDTKYTSERLGYDIKKEQPKEEGEENEEGI